MIKRFILFLAVSLSTSIVFGQYEPMAVEGAHWILFDKYNDSTYHHMLKLEGDTSVNGETFKKMYRREILSDAATVQDLMPPYYFTDPEQLIGLVRDDAVAEIVYGVLYDIPLGWCDINTEELIHDFSLSVGSPLVGCLHEDQGVSIASVDSIKTEFVWGKQREVQYVSTGYRYIEGIGGNTGPFSTSGPIVPGVWTEVVEYCIGSDVECGLEPVAIIEPHVSEFQVYPNPVDECLKIKLDDNLQGGMTVWLTSASGQLVYQKIFEHRVAPILHIETNSILSGVYFLKIQTKNQLQSHKIMVH